MDDEKEGQPTRPLRTAPDPALIHDGEAARVTFYTHERSTRCTVSVAPIIAGRMTGGRTFTAESIEDARTQMTHYAPPATHADVLRCLELTEERTKPKARPAPRPALQLTL